MTHGRPVVPKRGQISPGKILVFQGDSGRVLKINIAVNIALSIIHVSILIFQKNSWNHSNSTDKSKS